MDGNYKSYLISVGEAIKEYAIEAKEKKDNSIGTEKESFATGYLSGFYRIITLMQQQAEIYDISLKEISLDFNENNLI